MPEDGEDEEQSFAVDERGEDEERPGDVEGDRHHPLGKAGQDIERREGLEGLDLCLDRGVVGERDHSAVAREGDVGDHARKDEERDKYALDTAPPGPELEAGLAGEGDTPPPEVVTVDDVAADLFKEAGHEAEIDGKAGKGHCRAGRQKGEVERALCHEDERGVDDLHGDEEEGAEEKDPPGNAEPPDNPVTERERDDDLEQDDDGERGDDQRVH